MKRLASLPLGTRVAIMLAALVFGLCAWTFVASFALLFGTGLLRFYPRPSVQWWQYLPHARENARLHWWLIASGVFAAIPVAAAMLRLAWEMFLAERFMDERPLHGETRFASDGELRRKGFHFEKAGRYDS